MATDEDWMWRAIHLAREAEKNAEVPVGAIVVGNDGSILSAASNRTISDSDPTAHAEILAIRIAATRIRNYRLNGCTVYTTVEPCVMCAGALVNARIARLVYGTADERFGAVDTHFGIGLIDKLNHRIEVVSGVLAEECRALMQEFFRKRR
ncbi:MAG: tRNA adenosine(34) deaminase TadA [Acidobacteria bacterium]|nr:tRNA adenosine(34) deaminase TadA [Acidobacteriota bacterium]MCW5948835.1 tRNA adenosine(34) deaminase TadA [Pyrinomonadaceae bacterium]